ncbi:MAG TPA: stage II sporulation protein R, partial [Mobilitalea sp.]|nr:stage II sporulation protein R [Mobilitalea sp.]
PFFSRFHVIANSDRKEDQNLKYQVKDALVRTLYPYFKDITTIDDARSVIENNLPLIENVASQVIKNHGYSYPISASFTTCYFPMKVYGDYALPPGNYEALQVRIGDAQGQNWWCVMFPPLCFVDETYSIVSEDSEKKLKYLLTDDELDYIKANKVPVKIRFKLFDFIKKHFKI